MGSTSLFPKQSCIVIFFAILISLLWISFAFVRPRYNIGVANLNDRTAIKLALSDNKINIEKVFQLCQENGVYSPAVNAANSLLHGDTSVPLSTHEVSTIIKIYGAAAMVDDAIQVLELLADKDRVVLNNVHYNKVLFVCKMHKRYESALELFEKNFQSPYLSDFNEKLGLKPDKYTYSIMIFILCEVGRWKDVMIIYKSLLDPLSKVKLDHHLYSGLLKGLKNSRQYNACLEVYQDYRMSCRKGESKPSLVIENTIISIYGHLNRWEDAWAKFGELLESPDPAERPDKISLYTIIKVLRDAGQYEKMDTVRKLTIAKELQQEGNLFFGGKDRPEKLDSQINFNQVLNESKKRGNFTEAVAAAEAFLNLPPDKWTPSAITSCISIFSQAKRPNDALAILPLMASKGLTPNPQHYNAIMTACIKNSMPQHALEIFNGMRTRDAYSYGNAFKAYDDLNMWSAAWDLYNDINGSSVAVNTIMYNTILHALGRGKQWHKVFSVYNHMLELSRGSNNANSIELDRVTIFSILDTLEMDRQYDLIAYLKANCFPVIRKNPSEKTQKTVQKPFAPISPQIVDSMLRISDFIPVNDLTSNPSAESHHNIAMPKEHRADPAITSTKFTILDNFDDMTEVHPEVSQAGTLYQKLLESNPNSSVVEILRAAGRIDEALTIIDQLHQRGKKAHPSFYEAAIKACTPLGDWDRATRIFEKMMEFNVPRTTLTYRYLVGILQAYADDDDVLEYVAAQAKADNILL